MRLQAALPLSLAAYRQSMRKTAPLAAKDTRCGRATARIMRNSRLYHQPRAGHSPLFL